MIFDKLLCPYCHCENLEVRQYFLPCNVTNIRKFAQRVKNMRDWQKERANNPDTNTEYYVADNEELVDRLVAEILQEADNGKQ